jgi:hypothetical protein
VTLLIQALNSGNATPLQEEVIQIRKKIIYDENWILHDKGGYLKDAFGLQQDARYQNALWGNWLLMVLSNFLRPTTSFEYDWGKLSTTLHSLEWSAEDIKRATTGLPTGRLLQPKAIDYRGMVIKYEMPYWYWIRPMRCTYCGWLPTEEIIRLQKQLQSKQHLLEKNLKTLIRLPENISMAKSHISQELDPNYWYTRIPVIYNQAITMMEYAASNKQGLFIIIYQEYGDSDNL